MGAPRIPHGTSGTESPQDTRSWTPAALLLTGHHAQAPAVLNHSRTLPQGDGGARPAFAGGAEGEVGSRRGHPSGKTECAELDGDMKGPRSS